jgi:hypothetical protein
MYELEYWVVTISQQAGYRKKTYAETATELSEKSDIFWQNVEDIVLSYNGKTEYFFCVADFYSRLKELIRMEHS